MPSLPHIAVVDDEVDITALLAHYLIQHGFRVTPLQSGHALYDLIGRDPPDLILLDLGLPGEDGLAVARSVRDTWDGGLVIVSGRNDAVDKVVGLELGADDYVTKPIDLRELLARVKAVHRRTGAAHAHARAAQPSVAADDCIRFAGFTLDAGARTVVDEHGDEVALTSGEFDLLRVLAKNAGKVLSRDFLLEETRGRESGPFDRTIDVQIGRLRRKLEREPDGPQLIKAVRGAGYILVATTRG